jgi:hypothetical protein
MSEAPRPRRWRPWIALPTVALLLVVAGWSAFWFHAEHRASGVIDRWLAHEAAAGRHYGCADRSIGGYPLEIVVHCSEVSVELPGQNGPMTARAAGFSGLAQVYDPEHVIVELEGPLLLGPAGAKPLATLSWKLAEASLVGAPDADQRISVVLEQPTLNAAGTQLATANRIALHVRRDPEAPKQYDLAAHASQIVAPQTTRWFGGPLDTELQAAVSGIDRIPTAGVAELLRRFIAADGTLDVALLRLAAPDIAVEARGVVTLDAAGRPEGRLRVTGRAAPALLDEVFAGHNAELVRFGLSLLGQPTVLGGKRATQVEVDARKGKLSIGPIKVGAIPSLYRFLPSSASAAGKAP